MPGLFDELAAATLEVAPWGHNFALAWGAEPFLSDSELAIRIYEALGMSCDRAAGTLDEIAASCSYASRV